MDEIIFYKFCGYIGGILSASRMIPQVYHTYKSKSADDISYGMLYFTISGHMMGLIYSFGLNLKPIYMTMLPNSLLTLTVLLQKVYYSKRRTLLN